MRWLLLTAAMLLSVEAGLSAAETAVQQRLKQVTERGKRLYQYDIACAQATDIAQAENLEPEEAQMFLASNRSGSWEVVFGNLKGDRFAIAASVTKKNGKWHYERGVLKREEAGFWPAAARAVQKSKALFGPVDLPYNYAVLEENNRLLVYYYPAQTRHDQYILGADERFTFDRTGEKLIDRKRLHNGLIVFDTEPKAESGERQALQAGVHTVVTDIIPLETDVFMVLLRRPAAPQVVVFKDYVFQIKTDGEITGAYKR